MNLERPDLNSFDSTTAALFSRVRGHIEPGSHRMLKLLSHETLTALSSTPTILVSGTNGKGTMCSLLERSIRDSGFKTALYTSPHIVSPTERVRVNGVPIEKEDFLLEAQFAFNRAREHLPDATFFELMTAIAFRYIVRNETEVLICEVGLGGRLDSTNITSPTISILTSVGMDHTEWLGTTEESIAAEKAFISRRNRTFLVGPLSQAAHKGILSATCVTGAIVRKVTPETDGGNALIPLAQAALEEFAEASGLDIHKDQVLKSLSKNFWPGRFDKRWIASVPVLFDAAHNSHGVRHFLKLCQMNESQLPRPWTLVYASLSDKDWRESITLLLHQFTAVCFTQTQSTRSTNPDLLLQHACSIGASCSLSIQSQVSKALEISLEQARMTQGTLFVLGSITLIGESFEHWAIPVFAEQE